MEESIKHVKVRLIEGVEGDMKSVDGDEYLISTFFVDCNNKLNIDN